MAEDFAAPLFNSAGPQQFKSAIDAVSKSFTDFATKANSSLQPLVKTLDSLVDKATQLQKLTGGIGTGTGSNTTNNGGQSTNSFQGGGFGPQAQLAGNAAGDYGNWSSPGSNGFSSGSSGWSGTPNGGSNGAGQFSAGRLAVGAGIAGLSAIGTASPSSITAGYSWSGLAGYAKEAGISNPLAYLRGGNFSGYANASDLSGGLTQLFNSPAGGIGQKGFNTAANSAGAYSLATQALYGPGSTDFTQTAGMQVSLLSGRGFGALMQYGQLNQAGARQAGQNIFSSAYAVANALAVNKGYSSIRSLSGKQLLTGSFGLQNQLTNFAGIAGFSDPTQFANVTSQYLAGQSNYLRSHPNAPTSAYTLGMPGQTSQQQLSVMSNLGITDPGSRKALAAQIKSSASQLTDVSAAGASSTLAMTQAKAYQDVSQISTTLDSAYGVLKGYGGVFNKMLDALIFIKTATGIRGVLGGGSGGGVGKTIEGTVAGKAISKVAGKVLPKAIPAVAEMTAGEAAASIGLPLAAGLGTAYFMYKDVTAPIPTDPTSVKAQAAASNLRSFKQSKLFMPTLQGLTPEQRAAMKAFETTGTHAQQNINYAADLQWLNTGGAGPVPWTAKGGSSGAGAAGNSGSSSAMGTSGVSSSAPAGASGSGASVLADARRYLGVPYLWGGTTMKGVDCSGLTQDVYRDAGVSLPRTTYDQVKVGTAVPNIASAQPGDLVFYGGNGYDGSPGSPGHVGIYAGNGKMIDAPHKGTTVRYDPVGNPVAIRRILSGNGVGSVTNTNGGGGSSSVISTNGNTMSYGYGGNLGEGNNYSEAAALAGYLSAGFSSSPGGTGGNTTGNGGSSGGNLGAATPTSLPTSGGGTPAQNQALGQTMAASYGWTGVQWTDLLRLWSRESGWSTTAKNASSGAYGIAQALPASKYGSAGSDWMTNPATQIAWGLQYIKSRYSNPAGAWAHEVAHNWYDKGTQFVEGDQIAQLHKGEMVVRAGTAGAMRMNQMSSTTSAAASGGGASVTLAAGAIQIGSVSANSTSDVGSMIETVFAEIQRRLNMTALGSD